MLFVTFHDNNGAATWYLVSPEPNGEIEMNQDIHHELYIPNEVELSAVA